MSRIPHEDFVPHAPSGIGNMVHINHSTCPSGIDTRRRLYIRKTSDAIIAYCHNCGNYGIKSHANLRIQDIEKRLVESLSSEKPTTKKCTLPDDVVPLHSQDFEAEAKLWLYKHYLTNQDIHEANICYSPSWGRVILPYYGGGIIHPLFWQGRAVLPGQSPKYITSGNTKDYFYLTHCTRNSTSAVTIVEDILSAIRVGKHTDCIALLGTNMSDRVLDHILRRYSKVFVYMDPDGPGQQAANSIFQRLCLHFNRSEVGIVSADKQPKEQSNVELESLYKILLGDHA